MIRRYEKKSITISIKVGLEREGYYIVINIRREQTEFNCVETEFYDISLQNQTEEFLVNIQRFGASKTGLSSTATQHSLN